MSKRVWQWWCERSEEFQGLVVVSAFSVVCLLILWASGSFKDRPTAVVEVTSEGRTEGK